MEEGKDIPESVVMEILSRLPVKSLARFRCVCKPWSCSFQISHFITKHYHNNVENNNNLNLLLKRCQGNALDVDMSYLSSLSTEKGQNFEVKENIDSPFFLNCFFDPEVYGPCNGLLCLGAIWNPSTREFKSIPKLTVPRPPNVVFSTFDGLGFGFDSTTDDYKVVRFVKIYTYADDDYGYDEYEGDGGGVAGDVIHQVVLYSLKSDSWKEISVPEFFVSGLPMSNNYCYINGFCYWRISGYSEALLLSFDIANEEFSTLPLPNSGESLGPSLLLDFNGSLGAMFYPQQGTEKCLDLWVMNGMWTKQFSIEPIPGVERPLGLWRNGEIFLGSSNHELVLFDPATRELKNLGIDAHRKKMQLIAYFESLVPINGTSEDDETIIRQPAERHQADNENEEGSEEGLLAYEALMGYMCRLALEIAED